MSFTDCIAVTAIFAYAVWVGLWNRFCATMCNHKSSIFCQRRRRLLPPRNSPCPGARNCCRHSHAWAEASTLAPGPQSRRHHYWSSWAVDRAPRVITRHILESCFGSDTREVSFSLLISNSSSARDLSKPKLYLIFFIRTKKFQLLHLMKIQMVI